MGKLVETEEKICAAGIQTTLMFGTWSAGENQV